jgi:hypothetical protein
MTPSYKLAANRRKLAKGANWLPDAMLLTHDSLALQLGSGSCHVNSEEA